MTNFDFLKNFNYELYEIGAKLEEDVINSPRAVTADATLFLETLVKDLYKLSNKKLDKNLISFYKKIDYLYRQGVITYIYKGKLQDAYNLRNKIHKKNLDGAEEKKLAYDLHKRLYHISKKYYRDNCGNERYVDIPEYKKPTENAIRFENCIICGNSNRNSLSNMCRTCNQKIENANLMLTLQNTFKDNKFTRQDLVECGIGESEAILLLMDLSKYDAIKNRGSYYTFNTRNFREYLEEIDQYVEIGILLTRFYKNEITPSEVKKTMEYQQGLKNKKPYREFFKLVNRKIEKTFEMNLLKFRDVEKSIRQSMIEKSEIDNWFLKEKEAFVEGSLNDAFLLYNELLIDEFFKLKRRGFYDKDALKKLNIPSYVYIFWKNNYMGGGFSKKTNAVKKSIIIKEIKKNKSLYEALNTAGMSKTEFDKLYIISKDANDSFYKNFEKEYTQKRQKTLIRHLKRNNLNRAIRLTKITKTEFLKWYYHGELTYSDFYMQVTEILMNKYISYRENNWNKKAILKEINVSRDMYNSWLKHKDIDLFDEFEYRNEEITSNLVKRGLVINGIKEGKRKEEAIFDANLTPREFVNLYNKSKMEKTEFYLRFDMEYEKSRKNKFTQLIQKQDFYNSIQQCEISQAEFNKWYTKDQDMFISSNKSTAFYLTTTMELMEKYLKARREGKNKPDAAKSVGLSNMIINKWFNHLECDLFYDFKKKVNRLHIDLIEKGFRQCKSKMEVSEVYDISLKTIEEYIDLGKNGFLKYEEIFKLYESRVIPNHLKIFLNDFKTKTFYKSLKNAKLTKEELNYYYELGKSDENSFSDFAKRYLDLKISIYVDGILSKKSSKISLKNSSLTEDEFTENRDQIDEMILKGRVDIINSGILKRKTTGDKLAKTLGVSVEELYDWYFKGKQGDEKYEEFSKVFELGIIIPRLIAFNEASDMGASRKWLIKKLKKDLGSKDFKIWQEHGLIDFKATKIKINCIDDIDDEGLVELLKRSGLMKFLKRHAKSGDDSSLEISLDGPGEIEMPLKNKIVGK